MKITATHLATLTEACTAAIPTLPERNQYLSAGLTDKRYRWDVLHASRPNGKPYWKFLTDELYPYLDDTHIDTALRHIIP